jgi:hypothetical protein
MYEIKRKSDRARCWFGRIENRYLSSKRYNPPPASPPAKPSKPWRHQGEEGGGVFLPGVIAVAFATAPPLVERSARANHAHHLSDGEAHAMVCQRLRPSGEATPTRPATPAHPLSSIATSSQMHGSPASTSLDRPTKTSASALSVRIAAAIMSALASEDGHFAAVAGLLDRACFPRRLPPPPHTRP